MKTLVNIIAVGFLVVSGFASATPVNTKGGDVAIHGYDPVAYFTVGKPQKGDKQFSAQYQGATWIFSSEDHKARFVSEPEKYAPQYGGHCAFAAAHSQLADIDPMAWTIHEGKLYLNYSAQVKSRWLGDVSSNLQKSDAFWDTLRQE